MTIEHWAILALGAICILVLLSVFLKERELERMAEDLALMRQWADFWRRFAGDLMADAGMLEQKQTNVRLKAPNPATFPAMNVIDLKHRTVTRLWLN